MTGRTSARLLTAAALLFVGGTIVADTPKPSTPAPADERLKEVEEKVDRVLRLLETRDAPPSVAAGTSVVAAARAKVDAELSAKVNAYKAWLEKLQATAGPTPVGLSVYLERLSRIEARRAELKVKRAEVDDATKKAEGQALDRQIAALDAEFEAEAKGARAARKLEDEETMHRAEIERLRQLVAGLDAVLRGDLGAK